MYIDSESACRYWDFKKNLRRRDDDYRVTLFAVWSW